MTLYQPQVSKYQYNENSRVCIWNCFDLVWADVSALLTVCGLGPLNQGIIGPKIQYAYGCVMICATGPLFSESPNYISAEYCGHTRL